MKVLFVGEGLHDVGNSRREPGEVPARGVVPILAGRISPSSGEGVALRWTHLALIPLGKKQLDRGMSASGYKAKAKRAVVLSAMKYGCGGTVCVVDGDTAAADCLDALREGYAEAASLLRGTHFFAAGVAFQSIEAWTLGVPEAVAAELSLSVQEVRALLPGKHVEELSQQSGREEYQPRRILDAIARLARQTDCLDFLEAIAQRTDVPALIQACPHGFQPFVEALHEAFGARK